MFHLSLLDPLSDGVPICTGENIYRTLKLAPFYIFQKNRVCAYLRSERLIGGICVN